MELDVIGREPPERRGPRPVAALGAGVRWAAVRRDVRRGGRCAGLVGVAAVLVAAGGLLATRTVGSAGGPGLVTTAGGLTDVGDPALRARPELPADSADPELSSVADGPPDLAVRPLGGTSRRTGAGAVGTLQLEVRNSRVPLRLLSVTAVLSGVDFVTTVPANGTSLGTDGRIALALAYEIADCAELGAEGRLVLRVLRNDRWQDLVLPIRAEGPGVGSAEAPLPNLASSPWTGS